MARFRGGLRLRERSLHIAPQEMTMLCFTSRVARGSLALALAALSACADQVDTAAPEGPPAADGGGAERQELGAGPGNPTQWADGYFRTNGNIIDPSSPYTPGPSYSFDRAARFGGAITVTKPDTTTGRYVATFPHLSGYLGSRSTVHVSGYYNADDVTYCKPASAYLVSDKVEVRCFKVSTGAPANAGFTVLVTRSYSDLAFAYAHLDTATSSYSPSSKGSWNPAGTSTVVRSGVGQYRVTFNNLGSQLPPNVYGHVQVNAVGTSNAYCNAYNWGTDGTPNVYVDVRCYATPTGAPVDRKFTALFVLPSDHLAYAWADKPTTASYSPFAYYSSNPARGPINIARLGVGRYTVDWPYVDRELLNEGNVHVTAFGGNAVCKIASRLTLTSVLVQCFAPNGAPADSRYSVLLGS
jgi:hypothetical protein